MTQANSVHSTPPINTPISQNHGGTSRRRFLTDAARLAAGRTALFDLLAGPTTAENEALYALATAVPTTLAGITAMAAYFGEIAEREPWKLDGEVATALIASLAESLSGLAVQS
jgi:hypothetical protein